MPEPNRVPYATPEEAASMTGRKALDAEYEEYVLERVSGDADSGWEIRFDRGTCFGVPRESPVVPKVGDVARLYGRGIGFSVRGLDLNGITVFYRTPAQQEAKNAAEVTEQSRRAREEWEANRDALGTEYAALPDPFRRRHDRFRLADLDGLYRWEGYELFVATQATLLAGRFGRPGAVRWFHDLPYAEQRKAFPEFSDGHSGNTFGWSCQLAYLYLEDPESVVDIPPAMSPLLGDWTRPKEALSDAQV